MIAVLLVALPATVAQENETSAILTDPAGDVMATTAAGTQTVPGMEGIDLRAIYMSESEDALEFSIDVEALSDYPAQADSGRITIWMSHGDATYGVQASYPLDNSASATARLLIYDAGNRAFVPSEALDTTVEGTTITVSAEKGLFVDERGRPPSRGSSFLNITASSFAHVPASIWPTSDGTPATVEDHVEATARYDFVLGLPQEGNVLLRATDGFRASNGAAATYIMELQVENRGSADDVISFTSHDLPDLWDVVLPTSELKVSAGERLTIPVLVSVPFNHQHGSIDTATIQATSTTDDSSYAQAQVGVYYLATPQPSGHHPTSYIHTRLREGPSGTTDPLLGGSNGELYFNTLEDDAGDDRAAIAGSSRSTSSGTEYRWFTHLEPALEIGLDLQREDAVLSAPFTSPVELTDASWEARLLLLGAASESTSRYPPYGDRSATVLFEGQSEVFSLGPGESAVAEVSMSMVAAETLYRPTEGQSLVLELYLHDGNTYPAGLAPELTPGASIALPLNEYSDPVEAIFRTLTDAAVEPSGNTTKRGNPGDTILFEAIVSQYGSGDKEYTATLRGNGADKARMLGSNTFTLKDSDQASIAFAIEVPDDAVANSRIDVVLEVAEASSASAASGLVVYSVVVTEDPVDDDSAQVEDLDKPPAEATPVFAPAILLLALLVLVRWRRQ